MNRIATITALALSLCAGEVLAKGETPFEKAKGWDIERAAPGTTAPTCLMSKSYRDPDDNNAENAVIFALVGDKALITLVYEHWGWGKDEKVQVPFLLDKKVVNAKSEWKGDRQTLVSLVPVSVVPNMLAAKQVVLKFDDANADFDLAGFPEAYESLRRCDASAAKASAAPNAPSEARIKAFFLGAMVEAAINECDVPTSGKERAAFGTKMTALRKEMGPIEAAVQSEVANRAEPRCPTAADASKLQLTIRDFIDLEPEAFVASVEKRSSEQEPKAAPKP